jgi:hypothetical protein
MFLWEQELSTKVFKDSKALSAYLAEHCANVPTKSTSRNATLAYWSIIHTMPTRIKLTLTTIQQIASKTLTTLKNL